MLDTLVQVKDTVQATGWLGVQWSLNYVNYIFYTVLGLLFTVFYFYLRKRQDNIEDPNSWLQLWVKYKDVILVHLALYFVIIFAWITGGGQSIFSPITGFVKLATSIIGMDVNAGLEAFNKSIDVVMPKGILTYFTAFWGFFMTSIIRNWLPKIWIWIYNKFFKPKEQ